MPSITAAIVTTASASAGESGIATNAGAAQNGDFAALLTAQATTSADPAATPAATPPATPETQPLPAGALAAGNLPLTGKILPGELPVTPAAEGKSDAAADPVPQIASARLALQLRPTGKGPRTAEAKPGETGEPAAETTETETVSAPQTTTAQLVPGAVLAVLAPTAPDTPATTGSANAAVAIVPTTPAEASAVQTASTGTESAPAAKEAPAAASAPLRPGDAKTGRTGEAPGLAVQIVVEADEAAPREGVRPAEFRLDARALPGAAPQPVGRAAARSATPDASPLRALVAGEVRSVQTEAAAAVTAPVAAAVLDQAPARDPVFAAVAAKAAPETVRPHDFSALVDRLVAAREATETRSVTLAVPHADFGEVRLNLRHDASGLTVALSSSDADFARSVQAAAPTGGSTNGTFRHDGGADTSQRDPGQQPGGNPHRDQSRSAPARNHAAATRSDASARSGEAGIFA